MTLWDIYEKSSMFQSVRKGEMETGSASLFVCGILLRELFCPGIEICAPKTEYSWEQLWYIICIHHDRRFEQRTFWKLACKQKGMRETGIFSPLFIYGKAGIGFTNEVCVRESPVSELEVKDMFCFRNICSGRDGMDHGMAGGLLLFENLLFRHWKEKGEISEDFLHLYSYLANILMIHHVLKCPKDGALSKNPFLFFLLLAEAIEPLHYVEKVLDAKTILEKIDIELYDRELVLCVKDAGISWREYAGGVMAAAKTAGIHCVFRADLYELRMKMYESPIIDELFI